MSCAYRRPIVRSASAGYCGVTCSCLSRVMRERFGPSNLTPLLPSGMLGHVEEDAEDHDGDQRQHDVEEDLPEEG